jgi:hypothetical protein
MFCARRYLQKDVASLTLLMEALRVREPVNNEYASTYNETARRLWRIAHSEYHSMELLIIGTKWVLLKLSSCR